MSFLESPVNALHLAVREGLTHEFQFLIADNGVFLRDPLHRAVVFAQTPPISLWISLQFGDIALLSA